MFYPIQLDKTRNLRFGMRAISLIEKKFGKTISSIDMSNMTMDNIATFIWAGLLYEDDTLTPDKIMDLVDDYSDMETVFKTVREAVEQAFNDGNSDTEKNA